MNRSDIHPYQRRAVDFICEKKRCALWMFMGAGKSVVTLTAISDLLSASIIRKILIVAPLRVSTSVWPNEPKKWQHLSHLNISVATGTAKQRKDALNADTEITVINKENVTWLVNLCAEREKWNFDCIVLDESSAVKNHSTKIFRSLKKVIKHTTVFIELTGTPAPQSLMDVWSQMFLLDGGAVLGKGITAFRRKYFTPDYWGHSWDIKPGSPERIHALIAPMVLSMQAADYIQLPDRIDLVENVILPEHVMAQYKTFEKEMFIEFEDAEVEALSAAVLANRLLQFSSGAIYHNEEHDWTLIHNCKLEALAEIIEENSGENVIVAYNYHHDRERLMARFPEAVLLDKNPKIIDRWNAGEIKLMLCHPASASFGLNLQQGGSMIVWFSLCWSLEAYSQLCARLHRQGQTKPVRIVHLVAEGTIDCKVMRVLADKNAVQNDLLKSLRS